MWGPLWLGSARLGLAWLGLVELGLAWRRLVWLGLVCLGISSPGLTWPGLAGLGLAWLSSAWLGSAWFGFALLGLAFPFPFSLLLLFASLWGLASPRLSLSPCHSSLLFGALPLFAFIALLLCSAALRVLRLGPFWFACHCPSPSLHGQSFVPSTSQPLGRQFEGPCQAPGGLPEEMTPVGAPGGARRRALALRRSVTVRAGDFFQALVFLATFARIGDSAFLLFFIEQCY